MHNAYVWNTYYSTHTIQIQRITQLQIQIHPSLKKGPSCLHAIPSYYSRSSACLAIACALCNPQYCTMHTMHRMHTFQFSLFSTAHTCAIPVACNLSSSTGTLLRSHCWFVYYQHALDSISTSIHQTQVLVTCHNCLYYISLNVYAMRGH